MFGSSAACVCYLIAARIPLGQSLGRRATNQDLQVEWLLSKAVVPAYLFIYSQGRREIRYCINYKIRMMSF